MFNKITFRNVVNRYPVIIYCLIAFSITWGLKLLYVWYKGKFGIPLLNFSLLASFGPTISALVLVRVTEGIDGIVRIFRSLVDIRVGIGWILLAALYEPIIFGSITLGYWLFYGTFPTTVGISLIPDIGLYLGTFIVGLFMWGVSEEIGWRGWMLPKLQKKLSPLLASIVLAIVASLWHLKPNLLSDVFKSVEGPILYVYCPEIVERFVISIPFTMVITYIFNSTKGNLFLMLCFHSASNTSYFWIDGIFGVLKTDFFRISLTIMLVFIAIVFTYLLAKQSKKVIL
ncbi:MAG: CPBP family intramembrane glutamic endopeptidase [Tenuifilaceae bacterium]